jgi:hypothetical protein
MPKKTNKKTSAFLPSALTVANPTQYKSTISQPQATEAVPAAEETMKSSSLRPKRNKSVKLENKPDTSLPSAQLPKRASSVEKAPTPKSAQPCVVRLALFEPSAKQVSVAGAFNEWSTTPLTRQEDGKWETTLGLAPGRYEYKFVVDGQWASDPSARENVVNEFGTLNSVIEVSA